MFDAPYRLSFTTGGLLRAEASVVADAILNADCADTARIVAVERNLVQQRTAASTRRVTREVLQRLDELPRSGLEIVARGSVDDARHVMWLAACLRYRFLRDFGREVVRDRLISGRLVVTNEDFEGFWNLQSSWVDALRDTADSTKRRLRQNTFLSLREAGLLNAENEVLPVNLSPGVSAVIADAGREFFLSFPIHDAQVAAFAGRDGAR